MLRYLKVSAVLSAITSLMLGQSALAVEVTIESSAAPEHHAWAEKAREVLLKWHPRLTNLLSSPDFTPPQEVKLVLKKADEGVAAAAGNTIYVHTNWIESHPDDTGMLVHELTHVVQFYPCGAEWWVTEGIADYTRRAIFEGRPLSWFPVPKEEKGYLKGYNVSAGFLFYLETHHAPGIVRQLNTALRKREYDPALFQQQTGKSLDELWALYQKSRT